MKMSVRGLRSALRRPTQIKGRTGRLLVVCEVAVKRRDAILCKRIQAHQAAVTAGVVISSAAGLHEIATAALDKTVAYWQLNEDQGLEIARVVGSRITLRGGPAFSLLSDTEWGKQGMPVIYCGTATQGMVSWDPLTEHSHPKVVWPSHSGWIRALDNHGKWMLSADCNNLRLMDMSWTVPRHVDDATIDSGDILELSVQDRTVFASTTDGAIHRWDIVKRGLLEKSGSVLEAHNGRVTAVLLHKNLLFSTGFDGVLKMWDASTLECLAFASNAHSGKINAMTMGSDGLIYTGGEDGQIHRWDPKTLEVSGHPLVSHSHPIRMLSAGKGGTLVSGDASGLITIWDLCWSSN